MTFVADNNKTSPFYQNHRFDTHRPIRHGALYGMLLNCSTSGCGRNIFVSFKPPRPGNEPRTLAWKAAVLATTLGPPPSRHLKLSNHIYLKSFFVNNLNISQSLFSRFVVLKNQQYYSEIFVFLKLGHFQPRSRWSCDKRISVLI